MYVKCNVIMKNGRSAHCFGGWNHVYCQLQWKIGCLLKIYGGRWTFAERGIMPDALAGPKVCTTREKNNTTASGTIYDVTYWLTWFNWIPSERNILKSPHWRKTRKKKARRNVLSPNDTPRTKRCAQQKLASTKNWVTSERILGYTARKTNSKNRQITKNGYGMKSKWGKTALELMAEIKQ